MSIQKLYNADILYYELFLQNEDKDQSSYNVKQNDAYPVSKSAKINICIR